MAVLKEPESLSEVRDGMRVNWDVPIRMDDGIVLRCDVYRPVDEGRHPVILSYGPYGKGLAFQDAYAPQWAKMVAEHPDIAAGSTNKYQNWEVVDPEKWVPDGYVCVRVDSRGAGRSPGVFDIYSARETRDYYECIEWAAAQLWSNGKVGLCGISYYAMNQWQVASLQPPHLAAICPWEGSSDWYREFSYHGGIYSQFTAVWYPRYLATVQHGVGERGARSRSTGELVAGPETLPQEELLRNRVDFLAEIKSRPLMDDWYCGHNPDWSKVRVPVLSAANWGGHGLHARGNFEGFASAASEQKWLEVHGDAHWTHFYTDYGVNLQKRFLGHFLKGDDNGWANQPRVQLQIRQVDGTFVERAENDWPLARTDWTKYCLDATDGSMHRDPVSQAAAIAYDALGDGVTFSTRPLADETEITGPMAARLFISSSTRDADIFLAVRVFDPHGQEVTFQGSNDPNTPIALGWLRASHRKLDLEKSLPYRPYHTHDELLPLVPDEVYELDIEIWPGCIVIPPGYRLALAIRGKDYQYEGELSEFASTFHQANRGVGPFQHNDPDDRPAEVFGGRVKIYTGGSRQSWLLLPIISRPGEPARRPRSLRDGRISNGHSPRP